MLRPPLAQPAPRPTEGEHILLTTEEGLEIECAITRVRPNVFGRTVIDVRAVRVSGQASVNLSRVTPIQEARR